MNRRQAKKQHRREVEMVREVVGEAVPCPPQREGVNLVPAGYVGWVRITTPSGREKVRWVDEHGRVWRDNRSWHGGGHRVGLHAVHCRVEPVALSTGLHQWQADSLDAALAVAASRAIHPPADGIHGDRAHDGVLTGHHGGPVLFDEAQEATA